MIDISKVVRDIKHAFKDSPPNGFLLGWSGNRFFHEIDLAFEGKVINNTDFNYSFCNTYKISLGTVDSDNYDMFVKISFVSDVYVAYVLRYKGGSKFGKVLADNVGFEFYLDKIRFLMQEKGFSEICNEVEHHVDGVELELASVVTIGKCLFDDF